MVRFLMAASALVLLPQLAAAQIPEKAIQAWNSPASLQLLLEGDPPGISNDSFTAEIDGQLTWEVRGQAEGGERSGTSQTEVFVAKLDNALLISTKDLERGQETREIFVEGKYYRLYRGLDASDWMLVRQDEYTLPDTSDENPDENLLVNTTRLQNQNLHTLWGFAGYSFAELFELWEVLDVQSSEDRLVVRAKASEHNTFTMEFLPQENFRLLGWEKRTERPEGSGTEIVSIKDVSDDFRGFTKFVEKTGKLEGEETTSRETSRVKVNAQVPDAKLFDLASYNLRFRDPLPSGFRYWSILPVLVGIALIVLAVIVKRRAR